MDSSISEGQQNHSESLRALVIASLLSVIQGNASRRASCRSFCDIYKTRNTKIERALNTIVSSRMIRVSHVANRHVALLLSCVKLLETTVALIPSPLIYLRRAMSRISLHFHRATREPFVRFRRAATIINAHLFLREMYTGEDLASRSRDVNFPQSRELGAELVVRSKSGRSANSREIQVARIFHVFTCCSFHETGFFSSTHVRLSLDFSAYTTRNTTLRDAL